MCITYWPVLPYGPEWPDPGDPRGEVGREVDPPGGHGAALAPALLLVTEVGGGRGGSHPALLGHHRPDKGFD